VHVHVHETVDEIERSIERARQCAQYERLRRLGLLGRTSIAVHSFTVSGEEIQLLRGTAARRPLPVFNLKLASGFAPVAALLKRRSTSPSH